MPRIRIETAIAASPERCFDLARDVGAHIRSTAGTAERAVAGVTTGRMSLGDEVTWEARHLGIRQRLSARITRFDPPRMFQDDMVRGPFASMRHVHEFHPRDGGTTMVDTFTFASPLGPIGAIADRLFLTAYLRRFLMSRAAALKRMAESAS
ncbi:MAG: SRPBCC family protein [Chloroflexi bacterium]|nr:MAG: SRPBCC family protein [Chloroflexota bacterium]